MIPQVELFSGTTLTSLMEDIYKNSKKKDKQINDLIKTISPLISNAADAALLVPIIKEFLDVSVKNDEQLIKLATIVQRLLSMQTNISNSNSGGEFGFSEEEKQALIREAQNALKEIKEGTVK